MAKSKLTEKQSTYVENRLDGKSKCEAATLAGYAPDTAYAVERSDDVKEALAVARSQLSTATQIRRADVVEMLREAYELARTAAEPSAMVSAAKEIGKMLGFYEPETIKLQLTTSQSNLQSKFMVMSDEELLEIASGKAKVVDGEYKRLS